MKAGGANGVSTFVPRPAFKGKCYGCGERGHICSKCPKQKARRNYAALACTEEEVLNKSVDELGFIGVQELDDGRYDQPREPSENCVRFCGKHTMFMGEHGSSHVTDFQSCKKVKKAILKILVETQEFDMEDDWDGSGVSRKYIITGTTVRALLMRQQWCQQLTGM